MFLYSYLFCNLIAAREKEKLQRQAQQKNVAALKAQGSRAGSPSPSKKSIGISSPARSGAVTPARGGNDQRALDLSALNLTSNDEYVPTEEPPKVVLAREKVLEEARKALERQQASDFKLVSLVVIGMFGCGFRGSVG